MSVQDLISETEGTPVTVTGADAGECTAIPHKWEQDLGLPIVYGNAVDTYANADDVHYIKELNTPNNFPRAGAILVFKANTMADGFALGPAGHTAVVTNADLNTIYVIEQNWPLGSPAKQNQHSYGGVLGWFYPRVLIASNNGGNVALTYDQVVQIAETRRVQLEQETAKAEEVTAIAETRRVQLDDLSQKLSDLTGLAEARLAKINDMQTQLDQLHDQVGKLNALVAVQTNDTKLLNGFGQALYALIVRLGLKN